MTKVKRGPYKKYLFDPNVQIPKSTRYGFKKKIIENHNNNFKIKSSSYSKNLTNFDSTKHESIENNVTSNSTSSISFESVEVDQEINVTNETNDYNHAAIRSITASAESSINEIQIDYQETNTDAKLYSTITNG